LGIAVLGTSGRANTLRDSLLGDRFTNRVSVRLMRHATRLDLASFEDPVFYDKLERAAGRLPAAWVCWRPDERLPDAISLVSLSAGLIVFSPY
jgi:ATP-binding cassette subfamily B protein